MANERYPELHKEIAAYLEGDRLKQQGYHPLLPDAEADAVREAEEIFKEQREIGFPKRFEQELYVPANDTNLNQEQVCYTVQELLDTAKVALSGILKIDTEHTIETFLNRGRDYYSIICHNNPQETLLRIRKFRINDDRVETLEFGQITRRFNIGRDDTSFCYMGPGVYVLFPATDERCPVYSTTAGRNGIIGLLGQIAIDERKY